MANRRPKPEAVIPSHALVASSVRYTGGKAGRIYQRGKDWQKEAYRHYGICGEARFAANFFGHAMSRATLSAVTLDTKGQRIEAPTEVAETLDDMFNGPAGQEQILKAIGIHLTIAGECYLVGRDIYPEDIEEGEPPDEPYQLWEVISVLEMSVTGDKWSIKRSGAKVIDLTDDDVVIRLWLSDPSEAMQADSPFKSLLPILSEIEWLTRHVFAQLQSRLAGAGILFLPQSMSFPPPPEIDGAPAPANEAEAFMVSLADGMMKPIEDPSSPSAVIPYIVTAPEESIDKARLMTFWSELDAESKALRQEAIHRFALGMDLPPEQVEGMSSNAGTGGGRSTGVSHWGAWQIEESTIKLHIEPMLDVVCNAITISYLRPATGGSEFVIYDTSALRLRPDRSQEAILLYNLGVLSPKVLLRENGFDPDVDMPNDEERREWLLLKVATGSATPEQVAGALDQLGVSLPVVPTGTPRESRPDPSMEPLPAPKAPPEANALLAASEGLVFRALERAGNRLRNEGTKPPCPAYETHTLVPVNGKADFLLTDAWSCAPQVLDGLADPERVIPVLTSYCKTLFASQIPHSRDRLAAWLERVSS